MKFVILGCGDLGVLVADAAAGIPDLEPVGFLDKNPTRHGTKVQGLPVLGGNEKLEALRRDGVEGLFVAVGNPALREKLVAETRPHGFAYPTVIDPRTHISASAVVGSGCCVLMGALISSNVRIGDFVHVGTGTQVYHDVVVGDFSSLGGGSMIGKSVIGRRASMGVGVVIASVVGIRIGDDARFAAGSVVLNNIDAGDYVSGNPARSEQVRERVDAVNASNAARVASTPAADPLGRDEIKSVIDGFLKSDCFVDLAAVGANDPLFSSGRLSSLDYLDLTTFLEARFALSIADADMDIDHLDTRARIVEYVVAKLKAGE